MNRRMTRNMLILHVIFLGSFSVAVAQNTAQTSAPDAGMFERRVFELTNIERANRGLPPLRWNSALTDSARSHSRDMAERNYFSHTSPEGLTPTDRVKNAGYRYSVGENIGQGYRTPEAVVEGWMNSSGHRANILSRDYVELGVGFYNYYWTQIFGTIWELPGTSSVSSSYQYNRNETETRRDSKSSDNGVQFAGSFGMYANGLNQNLVSLGLPLQMGVGFNFARMRLNLLAEAGIGVGSSSLESSSLFFDNLLLEWHYGGMGEFYFPGGGFGLGFGYGKVDSRRLLNYDVNPPPGADPFNETYMRFALIFAKKSRFSIYGQLYGDGKWGFGFQWGKGW